MELRCGRGQRPVRRPGPRYADLYAQALLPSEVAETVVRAILAEDLWLFTDRDFDAALESRHRDIESRRTPGSPASIVAALLDEHEH